MFRPPSVGCANSTLNIFHLTAAWAMQAARTKVGRSIGSPSVPGIDARARFPYYIAQLRRFREPRPVSHAAHARANRGAPSAACGEFRTDPVSPRINPGIGRQSGAFSTSALALLGFFGERSLQPERLQVQSLRRPPSFAPAHVCPSKSSLSREACGLAPTRRRRSRF